MRRELSAINKIRVLDRGAEVGGLVTFTVKGPEPKFLCNELLKRKINVVPGYRNFAVIDFDEKQVEWAIRASPHYYNTTEEIDVFINAVAGTTLKVAFFFIHSIPHQTSSMQKDILIIGCNGYVSAILAKNGEELWRTKLRDGFFTGSRGSDVSVLIDGDQIFAGCHGRIYALRASDGEIIWENELKGIGFNEVALARQGTSTQFITRVEQSTSTSSSSSD